MARESSAGGVLYREHEGRWEIAVIQPRGRSVWALPKGHVDPGETPEQAAKREVREETGLQGATESELGEVRYRFSFRGKRIDKDVRFFLFRHEGGEIDALEPEMRVEVTRARWMALDQAERLLAYRGEREMAHRAHVLLTERGNGA